MECKDVKKYGYIAAFNYEAFLMIENVGMGKCVEQLVRNNKLLVSLKCEEESEETNEWNGFVSKM